jgi:hypothetical protein
MKYKFATIIFMVIGLSIFHTAYGQLFRIMPLGNSITHGVQNWGEVMVSGYRDDLAQMLLDEGIEFDMVGSLDDETGFYPRHEGHPGWCSYQIADHIEDWLSAYTPNIIFLEIGTNDISSLTSISDITSEIGKIVNKIHNYNNAVVVFIASTIPRLDTKDDLNDQLNVAIRQLVTDKRNQGYQLFYSAQNERFKQNAYWAINYMSDTVHPNDAGYHIMADQFFNDFISNVDPMNKFEVAGNIRYFKGDRAIPDVLMKVTEDVACSANSGTNGYYELPDLKIKKTYTITPQKTALTIAENTNKNIITSLSAAITLQQSIGLSNLTTQQKIAADIDQDGKIYAYDAAMIARFAVGLPPVNGTYVGNWLFSPTSRNYVAPNSDRLSENYSAVLLGDVYGNFGAVSELSKTNELTEKEHFSNEYQPGDIFTLSVNASSSGLLAFDIIADMPESYLRLKNITPVGEASFFQRMENVTMNNLHLGFYNTEPTKQAGNLVNLNFEVLQSITGFEVEKQTNFKDQYAVMTYHITTQLAAQPQKFTVHQNYPNPFSRKEDFANQNTTISYEIPKPGEVSVQIYNLLGQKVKILFQGVQLPGTKNLQWQGDADNGQSASAGIYICQIRYNGTLKNIRMMKMN